MPSPSNCRLPVSVLESNIAAEFERIVLRHDPSLELSVIPELVNPEIELFLDRITPKGPRANLETRKVELYESHLAFIWSYVYSSFVIFEIGVQGKMLAGTFNGSIEFDEEILVRARALQEWAISFSSEYAEWNEMLLPNPKLPHNSVEQYYCGRANAIFLNATSFLLLHEYAHLVLGHVKTEDDCWQLDQEKDADNFAMSFLVDSSATESERQVMGLSITLLYASNFFLARGLGGIWQSAHPHLHDRLRNGIAGLNLETEKSKFYIYYLASIGLQQYLQDQGIACEQIEEETAEDLFYACLDKIDALRGNRS